MRKALPGLILLSSLLLSPGPALAAFKSASDALAPEAAWNPAPDADDIDLPMPCGLSLSLRAVAIPSGALIHDKAFPMGVRDPKDRNRQIYERQFTGHIAAPFTAADLPPVWRRKTGADAPSRKDDSWYFIGKYEVSRAQWQAVMEALGPDGEERVSACPRPGAREGALPVSGISWFEAQEFLNRLNAWLVKNHADSLPSYEGTRNIAFLRLPTEEEWEYAARGGANVPPEWWAGQDVFPLGEDKSLGDYGVFNQGTALEGPSPIGSRNGNPLGLHDTIGNVREMVDGFFRMSIADIRDGQVERRLHGAAGGILTKGGSFRSQEDAVMPGWRDELPLYTRTGPSRQADLGMRIVLSGLNIPSAERLAALRQQAGAPKTQPEKEISIAGASPLEALEAITAAASGPVKKSLEELRTRLEDEASARSRRDTDILERDFRSLLYQGESLRSYALRYTYTTKNINELAGRAKKVKNPKQQQAAEEQLAKMRAEQSDYLESMRMTASYYKSGLATIYDAPRRELDRLLAQTRREYGGAGYFNERMRFDIDALEKFLDLARKKGIDSLDYGAILKYSLPERIYKQVPKD